MRILVAIPVFNEARYVRRVLEKVQRFNQDVLFIDDGSTDGTAEFLESQTGVRLIRHANNKGYGQSVIDAFKYADEAGFDWVITMDCDEQHEPEMIPEFVRAIQGDQWDIISGSRYLEERPDDDLPPHDRRRVNAEITKLINEQLPLRITDAFCGFKAHRVSSMIALKLDEPGYAFPLQLWPRVAHAGLRVTEIPVRLIYNDPNRHFGGNLDDVENRLRHYLEVFDREMQRATDESGCVGCCCPE